MRLRKFIATSLLALMGAPAMLVWADTGLTRGAAGITTAAADDRYWNITGDTAPSGTHDFTSGTLLAAIASAANEVMSRSAGDARYPQLAAVNTFTKANTFSATALPVTVTNTTDAADLELFKFYANRGSGNGEDGDTAALLFDFDDDSGTTGAPVRMIVVMGDANPKGGLFGSFLFQAGSAVPTTICKVDGVNNSVQADYFTFLDDIDTGMFGGAGLIQFITSNQARLEIVESGSYVRVAGFSLWVDNDHTVDGRLAVNTSIGAMDASVLAQFASTTQGTIPAPKMTSTQRDAISSPDDGLTIYDVTNKVHNFFNNSEWRAYIHAKATSLTVGSIPFVDAGYSFTDDNANFSWDDAANIMTISGIKMTGRLQGDQGADVASADEIALGTDGNYFDVTGTTTINHITKTGWQAGSVVVLQFDASVTVTHNAGSPAGTEASILLSGAGNFSATADDTLQLVYDGTTFREVSRTVI